MVRDRNFWWINFIHFRFIPRNDSLPSLFYIFPMLSQPSPRTEGYLGKVCAKVSKEKAGNNGMVNILIFWKLQSMNNITCKPQFLKSIVAQLRKNSPLWPPPSSHSCLTLILLIQSTLRWYVEIEKGRCISSGKYANLKT